MILLTQYNKKFALIDDKIVWYGNINLLKLDNLEDSIMRLESIESKHLRVPGIYHVQAE